LQIVLANAEHPPVPVHLLTQNGQTSVPKRFSGAKAWLIDAESGERIH
jgi:hypothetical protein